MKKRKDPFGKQEFNVYVSFYMHQGTSLIKLSISKENKKQKHESVKGALKKVEI